jgi:hypothetical protein
VTALNERDIQADVSGSRCVDVDAEGPRFEAVSLTCGFDVRRRTRLLGRFAAVAGGAGWRLTGSDEIPQRRYCATGGPR